jgi:CheY-like chemotaxis protein
VEGFSEGIGKGSEFILWLPLLEAAEAPALSGTAPLQMSESCRVLIVEDDADALESLRLQMELWGNEVTTARSAEEALEKAAAARPQIVLCDIGLPGMDGYRLVPALRKKLAGMPVVFAAVTGYATKDDQERALGAGFDSFLVKPLEPQTLTRLLRTAASQPA